MAGLAPEVGLAVLRKDLTAARRRVANRDALQQLAASTDELTESSGLLDARAALAASEQALDKARRERDHLEQLAVTLRSA